jgi:hypothetical protein
VTGGMEVVDKIGNSRVTSKKDADGHLRQEVPVEDVIIKSVRRKESP